jgi:hypothetical protein
VAISRRTLRLLRSLRGQVGGAADDATRGLSRRWVQAWESLAASWRTAVGDVVALAARLERWPSVWDLRRLSSVQAASAASEESLAELGAATAATAAGAAADAVAATAAVEPLIVASQYPAGYRQDAEGWLRTRLLPSALDLIIARVREQITSTTRPLSAEAAEAMRRELVRGVALGANPEDTARAMVARVQGAFEGGLARAVNIARTETLDAYRQVSHYANRQQADVLAGWRWHSTLDSRTCVACWAMHGTVWPLDQPGPWDHQQGRCARLPVLKPWSNIGIPGNEPADVVEDAEAKWRGMSRDEQDAAFGVARAEMVRNGRVAWADLAVLRRNSNWRPSYVPRSLRELRLIAARRAV